MGSLWLIVRIPSFSESVASSGRVACEFKMVDSCGLSILLKAWRERWTPLQWLVEIKKKVKKDGHKGLAECLVQQATFGTTPSMLILSYLKHGIMAEVVPCSEAVEAIQKFQNIEKHRCLTALLDLLLSFIPNLSCYDDGKDALDLTTSMVKLIYWLIIVAINLLKLSREAARSSDEASLHHHLGNTKRCHKAFSQLMSSATYRSLIMVGKMEYPGIATELDCQFQAHMKELFVVTQSEGMVPEVQIHFKDLMINYNRLHSLAPLNGAGDHQPGVVPNIAVQNIVQIQNLVFPTDSPEKLAGLLDAAMRTQNITRLQLFLEIMRSSLVGMLESPAKSMEEAIWTGFFFFKLPRVLNEMENKYQSQGTQTTTEHSTVQATLQQLRVFAPLLDDVDIKYKCNCYKEFIDQYCRHVPQQVAERLGNLSSARKSPSELESVTLGQTYQPFLLLLDAESKVMPVLQALEDEQTVKDDRFLNQLSSLFNVVHSKWRLVAVASLRKMPSLVAELIRLAEETKHPSEGDEASTLNSCVLRGDLFNAAFILLCHIAQVFGREVILEVARSRNLSNAFMTQWIASHIPESDHSRTFYSNPQYPPNPATVNLLLSQFYTRGPFMTSDARWDDLCVNVPVAMHEMLKSWQYESHTCSSDTIQKLCESIKYEVPAWAICVCCWCCGYSHELRMEQRAYYTGERSETGTSQSGLLQFLLTPINAKGMPQTFTDRCSMMVEVMKEMSVNIERKDYIRNIDQPAPFNETITKNMYQLFNDVIKQKYISSKTLRKFKQLLILGGAEWFCSTIIKELLKFNRQEDIANAVDIASCLMLLDTKLLVPVLIRRVIPLYLHHSNANKLLQDPKGWGLARLAAHAVNFGLLCEQGHDNVQQQRHDQGSSVKYKTETRQDVRYFTSQSDIQKALVWLCEELVSVVDDNKVGPVASVLKNFLQQAAQCNNPTSGSVLACLPTELTENLLELTPVVCCTPDVILGICSLKNSDGRKLCARVLCRSKQSD